MGPPQQKFWGSLGKFSGYLGKFVLGIWEIGEKEREVGKSAKIGENRGHRVIMRKIGEKREMESQVKPFFSEFFSLCKSNRALQWALMFSAFAHLAVASFPPQPTRPGFIFAFVAFLCLFFGIRT